MKSCCEHFSSDGVYELKCESDGQCNWSVPSFTLNKGRAQFAAIPIPDDNVDDVLDCP